ncbi:MAG: NAD(+)/NADH kinase, partial [Clostridiales bacterium]|nr:NAD(+)/NADH kinase [Clostridiales bacterium]
MENWLDTMKHFFVITNQYKDTHLRLTNQIADYIKSRGGTCACYTSTGEEKRGAVLAGAQIPDNAECVLVLGGDGTLIRVASALTEREIPIIGVNLGTLGYLCELEESNVLAAIDRLFEDHYVVEKRMMLAGCGIKEGKKVAEEIALNDIVLHRAETLSVVNLIVYVNGEYLHTFRADGMIVSTPTGSTGYNMSAGGPIVDPKADLLLITPINSHNLSSRSIVVGAEDEVVVEIGQRRFQKDETVEVSFDGD